MFLCSVFQPLSRSHFYFLSFIQLALVPRIGIRQRRTHQGPNAPSNDFPQLGVVPYNEEFLATLKRSPPTYVPLLSKFELNPLEVFLAKVQNLARADKPKSPQAIDVIVVIIPLLNQKEEK